MITDAQWQSGGRPRRLRRVSRWFRNVGPRAATATDVLSFGDLTLDLMTRDVSRAGRMIELTPTEYDLLEFFLRNPRRVLTRSEISTNVWGFDLSAMSNSLTVYIGYLRRKTEQEGETRLIHTVRGVGYILREVVAS